MTVVEKAAYLKGLCEGLGVEPSTKEGKLWGALCDLVSDMAHEIEELQQSNMDFADALDDISEDLTYLEELTCDLDKPEDEDFFGEDCSGDCASCGGCTGFELPEDDEEEDEELQYDGVLYDVICPKCGEEITFDEETLDAGSIVCPKCGENLEFDLDSIEDKKDDEEMPF